jgi:glutamate:Na+ symporter, ESS family
LDTALRELVLRDRPLAGRDYESAIISGAFCGFAMGATATAIANMQALTRRHVPSPQAFVIVPMVGAFLST